MSDIRIQRSHQLGLDGARNKIGEVEQKLKEKYGVSIAWRGNQADVKGTGVSGSLAIDEGQVSMDLKLGFLLKPMAGKIRQAIETALDRALV